MKTVADLTARLSELHQRTRETPLFNPVFQLSLDLSRGLEGGELTLSDLENMIAQLECESLKTRAAQLRGRVGPVSPTANAAELSSLCKAGDFAAFKAQ